MLQPKFNRYPKPTDLNSLYFLTQQAFEAGFRGTTFKELVNYIVEFLPDRLAQFHIYDVGPSDSPAASDDVTRTYQPTESGTYSYFLDGNGDPLEIDLSVGFVTITGNTATGFKPIVTPIDMTAYAKQAEVNTLSNMIGSFERLPYSGTLPFRLYNNADNATFVTASGSVSQTGNETSDTVIMTVSSSADAAYFDTGIPVEIDPDKSYVCSFRLLGYGTGTVVSFGIGYQNEVGNRGICFRTSTSSGVGDVIRTHPRTASTVFGDLPKLVPGDIVTIEAFINGPTAAEQRINVSVNGVVYFSGEWPFPIPVIDTTWNIVVRGVGSVECSKISKYSSNFASKEYIQEALHPTTPKLIEFKVLPDRPTGAPSGGFTCTGLDRITRGTYAGCWLVANDGRTVEGDGSPYTPEVLILDSAFNRILAVFPMPYTGASAQGVAVDTSGSSDTFWVATAGDGKIRHFDMSGAEITTDAFNWATAYPSLGNPNGLAYDSGNDALWCSDTNGNARLIACNPAASPRELATASLTGSPDMLQLIEGKIYYSVGSNGANGGIRYYDTASASVVNIYPTLINAQAIEGIFIDRDAGVLTVVNDGGYHDSANPSLNIVLRYRI